MPLILHSTLCLEEINTPPVRQTADSSAMNRYCIDNVNQPVDPRQARVLTPFKAAAAGQFSAHIELSR